MLRAFSHKSKGGKQETRGKSPLWLPLRFAYSEQPSDQSISGMAVQQNLPHNLDKWNAVVLWPMEMMYSQSVKQSAILERTWLHIAFGFKK